MRVRRSLTRPWRAPALLAAFALLACGVPVSAVLAQQKPPPSTFGQVVGNAVLCVDQIDNKAFYAYLLTAFGPRTSAPSTAAVLRSACPRSLSRRRGPCSGSSR